MVLFLLGVIVDAANVVRQHCFENTHGIPCSSDDEVGGNVSFTVILLNLFDS